jgi:hypothetical protein
MVAGGVMRQTVVGNRIVRMTGREADILHKLKTGGWLVAPDYGRTYRLRLPMDSMYGQVVQKRTIAKMREKGLLTQDLTVARS